jgi:hypothetical protein
MKGVGKLYSLRNTALETMWSLGAIQTDAVNKADYTLKMLTQKQITGLNPAWQSEGKVPIGSIVGSIKAYSALHYVDIAFNYN